MYTNLKSLHPWRDFVPEVLRSLHGSVRPYTRHLSTCKHANEPDYNRCSCPKRIYAYPKGGSRRRYALNTPSVTEALTVSANVLKGFDPEIAELRGQKAKAENNKKTVD